MPAVTQGWIRPHGCIQLPANCSASTESWQSLSKCLNLMGQGCLYRHCATTTSGSTSKLQVTNSWLFIFGAAVSKEEEGLIPSLCSDIEHFTCDRVADCLIAHLVQSVALLSPILEFVITTVVPQGRVFLWSGFIRISCLITSVNIWHVSEEDQCSPDPSWCSPFSFTLRSYTALAALGLLRDMNLAPGCVVVGRCGGQWRVELHTSLWLCPPSQASWLPTSLKLHFGGDTDPVRSVVCIFRLVCKSMPCMGMRVWEMRRKMRGCPCVAERCAGL